MEIKHRFFGALTFLYEFVYNIAKGGAKMRRRGFAPVCICFLGIGLVLAFFMPLKFLCVILALALVYLGLTYYKC